MTAPRTVVVSARRTPGVLSEVTRLSTVKTAVDSMSGLLPDNSCLDVSWIGHTIADVRSNTSYTPASTIKIVTAAVALEVLGADAVFSTEARGNFKDGVVNGDLVLVGGGDPLLVERIYPASEKYSTLSPTYIDDLADRIVAAGVNTITGGIVGDDSLFDDVRFPPTWPTDFYGTEGGPIGALMVNDGAIIGQPVKGDDPALSAAAILRLLLVQRGVSIGELSSHGVASEKLPVVATIDSAPMRDVVKEMLVNSDNNTAEILVKHIGVKLAKEGSWVAGLKAISGQLESWKLHTEGYVQVDGSGLSSQNRVSCRLLSQMLNRQSTVFLDSLSVSGSSGTLRDAFTNETVKGRLVGKTGTLTGVKSLAGFLKVDGAEPVQFTLLMARSGIDDQSQYRPVWYALARAMDKARPTPSLEELVP